VVGVIERNQTSTVHSMDIYHPCDIPLGRYWIFFIYVL